MNIVKQDILRIADSPLPWEKLQGKSVLVTGATGFIGSFIIKSLLQRVKNYNADISVIAFVRNADRAREKFAEYEDLDRITYVEQDMCESIDFDIKADFIIHCASNAAPDMYMNQIDRQLRLYLVCILKIVPNTPGHSSS
jgi:nucleoside-diphosphate-sugar epimerase